ncbi:unnamed protein product [Larinioides sclopetarius]|uniref:Secreted protein n=1 Tax=Larinioides sclopetarius TaxID=280406 RepID=A0AAV2BME0_9ARAC
MFFLTILRVRLHLIDYTPLLLLVLDDVSDLEIFSRHNHFSPQGVFVLRIGTKDVRVGVDRIKPVYVLSDDTPCPVASHRLYPIVTTRSGRRVRFGDFFQT